LSGHRRALPTVEAVLSSEAEPWQGVARSTCAR
jgi:hypothetical protein